MKFGPASLSALVLVASIEFTLPALAETQSYRAVLNGASEVPATASKGVGTADLAFDTSSKVLKYTITYSGLTGPATAAHIHGPAEAGKNAGVSVQFSNPASPIEGSAQLTDAQAADLAAGKMYINVHTADNKAGEIRGQVEQK